MNFLIIAVSFCVCSAGAITEGMMRFQREGMMRFQREEIGENSLKFEFVAKPIDDETLLVLKNLVYFEDEEGFIVCTGAYLSSGYIITLNECNFESDHEIIAVLGAANKESPPLEFRFSLKAKYLPFVKIELCYSMDDEQSEVEAGKGISITENAVTHGFAKAIGWKESKKPIVLIVSFTVNQAKNKIYACLHKAKIELGFKKGRDNSDIPRYKPKAGDLLVVGSQIIGVFLELTNGGHTGVYEYTYGYRSNFMDNN